MEVSYSLISAISIEVAVAQSRTSVNWNQTALYVISVDWVVVVVGCLVVEVLGERVGDRVVVVVVVVVVSPAGRVVTPLPSNENLI